jgi:class 3 adenylate cyclase/CHASE2 domain-containing sensor protein
MLPVFFSKCLLRFIVSETVMLSEERKQQLIEIGIGLSAGLLFFFLSFTIPYQRLELLSLDARFNLRPPIKQNPDIATIDIDNRALEEEGRWQDWTRDKHAKLLDVIRRGDGALVGVDIYFSEESERVVHFQDMKRAASVDEVFAKFRDFDEELATATKKAGNVYLGATFVFAEKGVDVKSPVFVNLSARRLPKDVLDFLLKEGSCISAPSANTNALPQAVSPQTFPIPRLVNVARGVGFAQIVREADGLVRKYPTFIQYEPKGEKTSYWFPSMGLAMACDYLKVPLKNLHVVPGKYIEIPGAFMSDGSRKTLRIPVNERGEMIINWAGDYKESFRHFPYSTLKRLGEQDSFYRIKEFLSSQDPDLFRHPDEMMKKVSSTFPDIDNVSTYFAYLYGAHWYEMLVEEGEKELSPSLFEEFFGLTPESAPGLFKDQTEVFNTVRTYVLMLSLLKKNPGISLKKAAENIAAEPELIEAAYNRIHDMLRTGGPKPSDHPLYFLEPLTLDGKQLSLDDLHGGVFFYGLTAEGTHDLNPMPFNPRYPMVGAIANVFNTIVTDQFITPLAVVWKFPVFIVIGLLAGFILSSRTTIRGSLFTMLFLIAYLLFAYWIFVDRRVWIDIVGPTGIIVMSDAGIIWYKFNTAEKKRRFIKNAFEHYMNPNVVAAIAKNPDMLELGGKEMELTAFFSDVAGFTTISEQLTAPQLVELLNEYLTAMTDIILKYDGLLDKYEGDAIMAVFGAPIHYSDHASKACFVALEMQAELKRIREQWKGEGKPELHARIGINSGMMVVGNMGSKTRFDYTVMGDAVNVASRLEGVNKQYSTYIMISEFTYALCKDDVRVREIDLIRVKGKAKPVTIYEVLARSTEKLTDDLVQAVQAYEAGLQAYRQRNWKDAMSAFEQALAARPDDGPSLTYLNRCKAYVTAPPPADWDGVYIMTTK